MEYEEGKLRDFYTCLKEIFIKLPKKKASVLIYESLIRSLRGNNMSHHPILPVDSQSILNEIKKEVPSTEKTGVCRVEQGKEFFQNYTFQDAILELDELFDP
jgi:hypothetical protein